MKSPATKSGKGIAADIRKAIASAERRGVTQYKIAKLAGMPQSQVKRVAEGRTVPTIETAERIVRSIGGKLAIVMPGKR